MLLLMMWLPARRLAIAVPIKAMLLDSEPPDVKRISFSCTLRDFAITARAARI